MRYACIHRRREQYSVRTMCRLLRVSRSGYYDWRNRGESTRKRRDRQLMPLVRQVHLRAVACTEPARCTANYWPVVRSVVVIRWPG